MAIQKINPSFNATLKGDYKKIIKISADKGLKDKYIKMALREIHQACPKEEDRVYLYYRVREGLDETGEMCISGFRSGIKVAKDGKVLELNVNPKSIPRKYLFPIMAMRVKQLVSGKIKPSEAIELYYKS